MRNRKEWWHPHGPLARALSVVVSVSMVLSLVPSQGVAEARSEIAEATQSASSETTPSESTDGQAANTEQSNETTQTVSNGTEGQQTEQQAEPTANEQPAETPAVPEDSKPTEPEQTQGTAEQTPAEQNAPPTSSNLAEFITGAELEDVDVDDGRAQLVEGAAYTVRLSFAERAEKQFAVDQEATFALPQQFVPAADQPRANEPTFLRYNDEAGAEQSIEIAPNAWRIDGHTVRLSWNVNDGDRERLASVQDGSLSIWVAGTFALGSETVTFGKNERSEDVSVDVYVAPKPEEKKDEKKEEKKEETSKPADGSAQNAEEKPEAGEDKAEQSAGEGQTSQKAPKQSKTEYSYEDKDVRVVATLDDAAAIPDEATLRVAPIAEGSADYEGYMAALNAKSDGAHDAQNTMIYDVSFVKDGEEVQPASGSVHVKFNFKNDQLADELDAQKRSHIDVTHLPIVNGAPKVEELDASVSVASETAEFTTPGFSAFAFSFTVDFTLGGYVYKMPGMESVLLSTLFTALGISDSVANVAKVEFSNPELVDVQQEGNNWRLASKQSFTTPEKLTVTMDTGNKYEIDVTDPPAVEPAPALGTQDVQLGTQATETILNNMVKSVSITAPAGTTEGSDYTLTPGDTYTITMSFAESGDNEFPNNATPMHYNMPNDFKLPTTEDKYFKIIVTDPTGGQHTVSGNKYKVNANNQLEVWFNTYDLNFHFLRDSTNARFSMSFDGEFDSNNTKIEFGNNVEVNVDIDTTSNVRSSKSASLDLSSDPPKINYTVAATSTGHSTEVQVSDTVTCNDKNGAVAAGVLTLDRGSFRLNTNKGDNAYQDQSITVGGVGNTFSYSIGSMQNGEVVTIKYSAEIHPSAIPKDDDGKTQVVIGNNVVNVHSDEDHNPPTSSVNTRIDYSPKLQKDGMTLNEDGKSFKASYTFNGDALVSGGGYTLTDTVGSYLTLNGTTGASVTVYNRDGSVVREKAAYNWGAGGFAKANDDKSFTYTVPSDDNGHNYKYVVEYEVKIDGTGQTLDNPTTVSNTVRYDNDHKSTGTGIITPSDDGKFEFNKHVENIDYANKRVKWTTTINVPTIGLNEARATVTDTLPSRWAPSGWVQDELYVIPGDSDYHQSVKVTGLLPGESYEVRPNPGSSGTASTFTLEFYKANNGGKGLAGGDHARIVTVAYETSIDQNWLTGAADNSWLQNHTNSATIDNETKTATADIAGAGVTKNSEVAGYRTVNGVKLPVYKYTLLLKNVTQDDNTVKDFFDTEILTPLAPDATGNYPSSMGTLSFSPDYFAWYTTNQDNGTGSTNPVSYIPISERDGNTNTVQNGIAISTNYDSMVRDPSTPTGYYPVTKIMYYLTVKDEAALKKLQNRAVNNADGDVDDKTYTLTNTAKWGASTDPGDVKYRFPGITKEMLNDNGQPMTQQDLTVEDGEIFGTFKLTVNPGGQIINGGHPYKIVDTINNLGIDITSIQVTPTPDAGEVVYDMRGKELTFSNVPDGHEYVITYRARVMYDSTGNIGDTIDVNVKNDVRMLAYEDHVNEWAYRKNNGTSAAGPFAIKLMKYEAGDMSQKLDGAEFALYESKAGDDGAINASHPTGYVINIEKPVKDKDGNVVTFTSGGTRKYGLDSTAVDADGSTDGIQEEPGMVTVYGLKNEDGWALEPDTYYFLRETKAPENHKLPSSDFQFMLSKDGSTNHESHIYHSNDTMSAKNCPGKDIHIKKYWGTVKQGGNPDDPADRSYQPADTEKVVVRLQQKIGDGDWSNTIRREVKQGDATVWVDAKEADYPTGNVYSPLIELNKSNGWEADFKDLPLAVPTGDDFKGEDAQVEYQVLEWTIKGEEANQGTVQTSGSNNEYTWTYELQDNDVFITNVPKEGSIKLRKEVQIDGQATTGTLADGWYDFTISGKKNTKTSSVKKVVSVEVKNGTMTKAIVDGDSNHPLTPGADGYVEVGSFKIGPYTVHEETPPNVMSLVGTNDRSVTVTGETGDEVPDAGKVTFTNNVDLGGLKIKKVVAENSVDSVSSRRAKDKLAGTYNFNVYTDEACTNLVKTVDGKDARLSITIGNDGQAVTGDEIQNLKVGDYWVRETLPEGSAASPAENPVRVTVEKGKTGEAAVIATLTNKYDTGFLKIKKNVTINGVPAVQSDNKAKTDGTYAFQIWKGNYLSEEMQRGRVQITFKDGAATSAQYEWTDERTGGPKGTPNWKTDDITVVDGVVTLKGVEAGTYTIHEIENQLPTGMALVNGHGQGGNDQQVTVKAGDIETIQTAEFTNDYEELGGFELKKSIITKSPIAAQNMPFNFTIMMYKDAACTEVDTSIEGNYGQITFHNGVATNIRLVGNEKKTASNLPTGRYYKIVEDSAEGWSLTGITVNEANQTTAGAATGKITTTESKVEFKNELDEGNLKVQKVVVSNYNQDKTKEFRFKVVLDGYALTGTYGEGSTAMNFTNGAAEFTLKHGQYKEAIKLPANIKYTVTETTEEGFVTTWTGDTGITNPPSGTITKGTPKTVTATNTREYGNLEIDKTVLPASRQGSGDEFTFTVSLSDKSINGTFESVSPTHKSITFTSGVGQVTLKHGEVAGVKDLPAGITYAVTEAKAEGFALSGVTGNAGKIVSQTTAKAEFTNQCDNGGLVISKNVNSATSTDDDLYFPFKVTISLPAGGTYLGLNGKVTEGDDISYANGVAYVFLKKGQQAVSNRLEDGCGYEVRELDISDASVKTEVQEHLPDGVTIDQVADLSRYSTVIQDGSNKIVNPNGGTIASGKISAATSSARYTNTHITGPLTISKKLVSDAAVDRNKEFAFEVKMLKAAGGEVDTSINGAFGGMTFSQGVATVAVRGNGSVTATGLPEGLAFEIAEKDMPANFTMKGYAIDGVAGMGATARGNIARGGRTVEFTNEHATGPLTLSKELISGRAADANQDFTFTVRLSDTSITKEYDATYTPAKDPAETKVRFTQGVATVTLKGGQTVKIDGLPTELQYMVTEAETPGFRMTGVTKSEHGGTVAAATDAVEGVIVSDSDGAITYQNTRTSGELTVSKKLISDLPADSALPFDFNIEFDGLTDAAKNGQFDISYSGQNAPDGTGKIQLTNGVATIRLIGGASATIAGLPSDVTYTVTEANVPDFLIKGVTGTGTDIKTNNVVNGKTGTITTKPATVEITNERKTGKLTVTKKLFSQKTADLNKDFTFVVSLGHLEGEPGSETFVKDDIDKTFNGITFTDGEGSLMLKGGQSKTIDGLPYGIRYEVREVATGEGSNDGIVLSGVANDGNESNLEATRTKADGAISAAESKALFKNTGKRGGLQGSKAVSGPTAPDQEFTFTLRLAGVAEVNGEGFTDGGTTYSYGKYYANASDAAGTAISFSNGAATFKIKKGGSFKFENLPLGTHYTLTETSATGFATAVTNGTQVASASDAVPGNWYFETGEGGKTAGVTYVGEVVESTDGGATFAGPAFSNTHEEGSLRIHKVVDSKYPTDKVVSYTFRVELSDKNITAVEGDSPTTYITDSGYDKVNGGDNIIPFMNGVATFTLSHDKYASITGLPAGTTYTVTETSVEGIETTWTDTVSDEEAVRHEGKGTIKRDATATTEATNKRIPAALDVVNTVISHSADDKKKETEYTFKVSFYSDKNLQTPAFVNMKYSTDDYNAELSSSSTTEFRLSDGEVCHFTELPQGIYYKVEETGKYVNGQMVPIDEGMTTSTKLGQRRIDSGKIDKFTSSRVTNTRIEGGLVVHKNVSSHIESDKQKEFDFRVTLYKELPGEDASDEELANLIDTSVNGVYGTGENAMNFVGGVATFKLKDGEFRYAMNLKTGLYFRAMEVNDPNFNVATSGTKVEQGVITYKENNQDKQWGPSTGEQGQIPNSGNATARITNNRKAGNLKVEKSSQGAIGSADDEFFFTVELSDKSINGTFGEVIEGVDHRMIFNNGVATFSLKKGEWKSTVEHEGEGDNRREVGTLPVGVRYRVTERNAYGYLTSWESVTYANDTDGPNDTPTTYSYQYNQTWNNNEAAEGLPYYHEGRETRTITWGGTHTSTAVNTAFPKPTDETGKDKEYDGSAHSWTLGDHATEWGWRDDKGESTLLVNGITENNGTPNTDTVTFKNDQQMASIVLYKQVTSGLKSDSDKTFRFHLQLLDSVPASTTYNAAFYKQKVTTSGDTESISYDFSKNDTVSFDGNGMGTVSGASAEGFGLKAGDIIVISGLPLGTRYKVTEDTDSDFDSTNMGDTGRAGYGLNGEKLLIADELRNGGLPDTRARSGYDNIRKMGELEVRKTVDSDLQSDKDENAKYTFSIQLNDESYNSVFSMARAVAQKDNFDQDMYYSKTNPDEVLITGYDENVYREDDEGNKEYKPIYDTVNGVRHYSYQVSENDLVQFTDGSATIQLKDGEFAHFYVDNVTGDDAWKPAQGEIALIPYDSANKNYYNFGGLPRGVSYTVTETDSRGLTPSWAGTTNADDNATGIISTNALAVADCTNTREGGNLTVSKELISEVAADKTQVFDFTVRLYSDEQHTKPLALSGKYGDMTFSNGVATVQILGGNSSTATGLPNDTYYTVTEASATGFELMRVTVNGTEDQKSYESTTTDEEGHQTTTTEEGSQGQILSTTPSTVVFTNKRVTGPLRITKQLYSMATADQDREFVITVRLDDTSINTKANDGVHGKVGDDKQLVFTNGIATVRLKNGECASITNLPTGVEYSVNEENASGYLQTQSKVDKNGEQQTSGGGDGMSLQAAAMYEIVSESSEVGTITIKENNTRDLGSFTIRKLFAPDKETGEGQTFLFKVKLYTTYVGENDPANVAEKGITTNPDATGTENPPQTFGDLVFDENGEAMVKLNKDNNWSATAKNIPAGLYYTIEEQMTDSQKENYRLVNNVGTIQSGQVVNGALIAPFTNERIYKGDLTVKKQLVYPELERDAEQDFTLKVTLYTDWTKGTVAEDIDKTYATLSTDDKPLEFHDGVATVTLKHDQRASAKELPAGMAYDVEEVASNTLQGFTPTTEYKLNGAEDGQHVIAEDGLSSAVVKNQRETTNASVKKEWHEDNKLAGTKSKIPDSIDVKLMRNDNAATPYLTVTLNKENNWTATPDTVPELGKLPLKDYNGNDYTYQWDESVDGWTREAITYSKDNEPQVGVNNAAGYLTTIHNRINVGSLKVTKHVDGAELSDAEREAITFTVTDENKVQIATAKLSDFRVAQGDTDPSWTITGLPIGTYFVAETSPTRENWTVTTTYSVEEGRTTVVEDQTANVQVTNTYRGKLNITKNVTHVGKPTTGTEADGTYKFDVTGPENYKNAVELVVKDGKAATTTLDNLVPGTYTVTEQAPTNGTYLVSPNGVQVEVTPEATTTVPTATFTNDKPDKPSFDKKIKDTNDTTGVTSDWQDSADYDIGDAVPYRLTATLASDVTAYKRYHVTFSDRMEGSLTYNKDAVITVTGADGKAIDPSSYTVEKVAENDHDFAYKISWADTDNSALNGAKVEVEFSAKLQDDPKLGDEGKVRFGKQGNVNACKLAYSNNPASEDDKDEGQLPWDYVIAFTYKLDVSKVDPDAKPLAGAEFTLEKLVKGATDADDKYEAVKTVSNGGGEGKNVFTVTGLDDGTYRLTETKAPNGYKEIAPITFEVTADHDAVWNDILDITADPSFSRDDRTNILKSLTGKEETGALTLAADGQLAGLAGTVKNTPPDKPSFDKKIKDANDSTGETSGWQDSADYDIGDAVPFKLTATLAGDVTAYKRYHVTFTDRMEPSLTFDEKSVEVYLNDTRLESDAYELTKTDDQNFTVKLSWGDGKEPISDATLNGARVEVLFSATLNDKANLGKRGNANACKLAYSSNPQSADDSDEGELPWDYVIAFTYQLDINKVDSEGKPLAGAEFSLEKLVKGSTDADDKYEAVKTVSNGGGDSKNVFTATGLDDGTYRLTETKAPEGYVAASPVTFTVTADHNVVWDYTSDAAADPAFSPDGRADILNGLTGELTDGKLKIADGETLKTLEVGSKTDWVVTESLAAYVENTPGATPVKGAIQVKKTVVSTRGEDKEREYDFKVTLYYNEKDQSDGNIATAVNGKYGDLEFKDGVATFTLKHNETKKATDLPVDEYPELAWGAEETDSKGLTPSGGLERTLLDGTKSRTFTNTYTAPKDSASSTTSSRDSTPKTSDDTNFVPAVVIAVVGAAIVAGGIVYRKRKNQ